MVAAAAGPVSGRAGPALSSGPTLEGAAAQGSRLVATPGSWQGSGTLRYVYRWYRCDPMGRRCVVLRGARAPRRKLGPNDVGHTLAVNVRATDTTGSTNGYSSLIGPIGGSPSPLVSTVQPTVSGSTAIGGTVQADTGRWSRTPASISYQWIRCNANGRGCAPIRGDTAPSHTVVQRDSAHALVAIVQARWGSTARAVLSRAARVGVAPPPPAPLLAGPTASAPPWAAGPVLQGKQLTGVPGTWSGVGTIQYAYNWYRCDGGGAHCMSIHGATKPTYTQVAKDLGKTLGFTVRATDANGTASAHAGLVGPVVAANAPLYSTVQPTISGTPAPGQTLQVNPGSWSLIPTAYFYQWERCNPNGRLCTPVTGATAAFYTVTGDDRRHAITVVVQAVAGPVKQLTISARAFVG